MKRKPYEIRPTPSTDKKSDHKTKPMIMIDANMTNMYRYVKFR